MQLLWLKHFLKYCCRDMICLGLDTAQPCFESIGSKNFFALSLPHSAAVTSDKMTKAPGTYSGLNLVAIQPTAIRDTLAEEVPAAVKAIQLDQPEADLLQTDQPQTDLLQTEPAQPEQTQSNPAEAEQAQSPQSEGILLPPSEGSMQDYYHLQQNLLGLTVVFGALIFPFVWGFYSLPIALDYTLGACAGIVYLKMLGRNVSTIGRQKKNSSAGRLAVFAGVMIVALRWEQVEVIPVFLGFLTYKAAIVAFVLWTALRPTPVGSQGSQVL